MRTFLCSCDKHIFTALNFLSDRMCWTADILLVANSATMFYITNAQVWLAVRQNHKLNILSKGKVSRGKNMLLTVWYGMVQAVRCPQTNMVSSLDLLSQSVMQTSHAGALCTLPSESDGKGDRDKGERFYESNIA